MGLREFEELEETPEDFDCVSGQYKTFATTSSSFTSWLLAEWRLRVISMTRWTWMEKGLVLMRNCSKQVLSVACQCNRANSSQDSSPTEEAPSVRDVREAVGSRRA